MAEHDIITLPDSMRVFERGWLSSNNILFFDEEAHGGCALVDSGYLTHAPQTIALVQHALTGHEAQIPTRTNVDYVDEYRPKPTGAIADDVWAREKLTPASFALQNGGIDGASVVGCVVR